MTGADFAVTKPGVRRKPARATSPVTQVAQLVVRAALILVVAGVVIAAASAIGSTPLAQRLPGSLFPFGQDGRGPAGPEDIAAGAPTDSSQTGVPTGSQPGRTRGPGSGNQGVAGNGPGAGGPGQQGLFSGRNSPSLQRGWLEEVRYLAIFAAMTAAVALALRFIRPKRRRVRVSAAA
jgi:hypothetical protein